MQTTLNNKLLQLRHFELSDSPHVAKLCNNIKIWQNVKDQFPHPYNNEHAINFIKAVNSETLITTFAIDYDNKLVGAIGLTLQDDVYRRSAELGYWIGEPYWGLGIASAAVKLILHIGFNRLDLIRIYAGVFENNQASMRVLEKAGFTKECIARKAIVKDNKILDGHRFAIVK
jgi:ribosomal-protein-alanine N-acetyltransferase